MATLFVPTATAKKPDETKVPAPAAPAVPAVNPLASVAAGAAKAVNQLNFTTGAKLGAGPEPVQYIQAGANKVNAGKAAGPAQVNPYDALTADALARLKELESGKPGAYSSMYQAQIDALLNSITGMDKFSYDLEADPLYRQYRSQYMNLGGQAMRDTTANAASLTGGYGNSYASTAGNQAFQAYLGKLNDAVPGLYDSALKAYQNRIAAMNNQMSQLNQQEQAAYGRYQDEYSQYQNDLQYWYNKWLEQQKLQAAWKPKK